MLAFQQFAGGEVQRLLRLGNNVNALRVLVARDLHFFDRILRAPVMLLAVLEQWR